MKIYVATAFTNKDEAKFWMNKLRAIGVEITHDWTVAEQPERGELELTLDQQKAHAHADVDGVKYADIVWVLSPGLSGGTGCWFEMGVAYGMALYRGSQRPMGALSPLPSGVIVSGPRRTIFTSLVDYRETHAEAFDLIQSLK